jgi:hypothetical protein
MTYREWFDAHAEKHRALVEKLLKKGLNKEEIIDYFAFENMVEKEPEFCELYKTRTKCHRSEYLNCYLCACPNFRFTDRPEPDEEGNIVYSYCAIGSKEGKVFVHGKERHQDCSECIVPHLRSYIESHFDTDWRKIMEKCDVSETEEEEKEN